MELHNGLTLDTFRNLLKPLESSSLVGFIRSRLGETSNAPPKVASEAGSEWLQEFRQLCQIDSIQFADCWNHYDEDGECFLFILKIFFFFF